MRRTPLRARPKWTPFLHDRTCQFACAKRRHPAPHSASRRTFATRKPDANQDDTEAPITPNAHGRYDSSGGTPNARACGIKFFYINGIKYKNYEVPASTSLSTSEYRELYYIYSSILGGTHRYSLQFRGFEDLVAIPDD